MTLARLFEQRLLDPPSWQALWNQRLRSKGGPLALIQLCCDSGILDFTWRDSLTLCAGPYTFSLTNVPGVSECTWRHNLRELLQCAAWRAEASRRPKDFDGVQNGVDLASARPISFVECGPSLLAAGQWTAVKAHLAFDTPSDLCPRCWACPETLEHRLWHCDDNRDLYLALAQALPANFQPSHLPNCLRRCALIPRSWQNRSYVRHIIAYLLSVSRLATSALASARFAPDAPS